MVLKLDRILASVQHMRGQACARGPCVPRLVEAFRESHSDSRNASDASSTKRPCLARNLSLGLVCVQIVLYAARHAERHSNTTHGGISECRAALSAAIGQVASRLFANSSMALGKSGQASKRHAVTSEKHGTENVSATLDVFLALHGGAADGPKCVGRLPLSRQPSIVARVVRQTCESAAGKSRGTRFWGSRNGTSVDYVMLYI
jgi:hypothetical protein